MWDDLGRALALMLVIEGMWPFLAPARWRIMLAQLAHTPDRVLRGAGLASMVIGLLLLHLLRSGPN